MRKLLLGIAALFAAATALALLARWRPWNPRSWSTTVTGTVEAPEVDVAAEVTGQIRELRVEEGASVQRGQVVAVLDATEATLKLERSRARLATAKAELEDLKSLPRKEDLDWQRSKVSEMEVLVEDARSELARGRRLRAAQSMTEAQLEQRFSSLRLAERRLETVRRELAALAAGARPGRIQAASTRVDELAREVDLASLDVAHAQIAAPIDGVVLRRNFEPGELVEKGKALLSLIDPSQLWIELSADEQIHGRIAVGQPATIRAEATDGQPIAGRVSFVADRHAFTPRNVQTRDERAKLSYRVKVRVERPPRALKPGMFVEVRFSPAKEPHELHARD